MEIAQIANAAWNVGLARFAKEFLFDASFFVLLTSLGFVACQGRFARFFRPVALLIVLLFAAICTSGAALLVAQPLLNAAHKLNTDSIQSGCREKASVIVILAGGIVSTELPTKASAFRVFEAAQFLRAQLQKNNPTAKVEGAKKTKTEQKFTVVITGGTTSSEIPVPEAVPLERMLRLELGEFASQVQILREEQSKNTFQNAFFTKELMEKRGMLKNILLVTSLVHMPRSSATFKRVGFNVCTLTAPSPELSGVGFVSFENGALMMGVINEFAGQVGYAARGWL